MALRQHISLMMMPFHTSRGHEKMLEPGEGSIWSPCQISFDKGKLYSHIAQFLNPETNEGNTYHYRYYSLSNKAETLKEMFKRPMTVEVKNADGGVRNIVFSLGETEEAKEQETFFSPKLVVCPSAGVGMLMFSVHLGYMSGNADNFMLNNVIDLNYAIFKTYSAGSSQTHPIYLKSQMDIRQCERRLGELSVVEGTEKERARLEQQLAGMRSKLPQKLEVIDAALCRGKATEADTESHWTMRELTERLMADFAGEYERFDPYRLHVFTYLQMDEADMSQALADDFLRIVKLQNSNYQVLNISGSASAYEQTFQNVYLGCTVEGSAIMTLACTEGKTASYTSNFIKDFMRGTLSQSYLWTYVMVQMQRHTLLFIEHQLTQHSYMKNSADERNTLRKLIGNATQNKLGSYFIDISDHTQHNQFYSLCCRNFKIKEYAESIEQKLEMLTDYLKMLTEQQSEEEAKRLDAIGQWITVIGAVFALFSSTYDAFGLFDSDHLGFFTHSSSLFYRISVVLGSIFCIAVIFWILVRMYVGRKRLGRKE